MVTSAEHDGGFWPSLYAQLRGSEPDAHAWFSPLASAVADAAEYLIRIELPGVVAQDITLKIQHDSLVIEGTKANAEQDGSVVVFFNERLDGHFMRSFKLPPDADLARFTSTVDSGVLLIRVPRRAAIHLDGMHPVTVG